MSSNIVVIGSSNTDLIIKVDRIPRPGETILGGEFSIAAGGKGANQAVSAARAGGAVTFVARVGRDMFGQKAIDGFVKDHINIDYVLKDKTHPSGMALIFVDRNGENSIAVAAGANGALCPADVKRAKSAIASASVLIVQLEIPLETVQAAIEIASAHGVRVILNPAPARPLDDALLKRLSLITPNETEAERLTGIKVDSQAAAVQASHALLAKGVQTVIITLGAQGALAATKDGCLLVPGFKVTPLDTTAAGDVFNGALAVALAEDRPLADAVRFANGAGAISVTKLGAQPSAPKRNEIEKFLRENAR
jgi:ribokinase